jgi:hypothetical protein
VEERFVEEPVMDLDGVLVDAVERVLGQSGYSSMASSVPRPWVGLSCPEKKLANCEAEAAPVDPRGLVSDPSTSDVDGSEKWVDVATTLIADTKASTVKRLPQSCDPL